MNDLLPITFVDVRPLSLFRRIIGGMVVLALGGIALWLLWPRQRSLLDQWLVVALCALLLEVVLASVLSAGRYNLAWYAGRFYQLVTATVVMVVLLAEMTRLYAGLARSNTMLQRERMMLQRALDAQRRERDARLITGDAVAATIAHEVKQPLAAMITRSETGLRWLDRAAPDLDKARAEFRQIAADGHRAAAVIESIRANFRKDAGVRVPLDLDNLIDEAIALLQDDLKKSSNIGSKLRRSARPLQVMGDRIQLQQVLLNSDHECDRGDGDRGWSSRSRREFRCSRRWRCDDFDRRHRHGHQPRRTCSGYSIRSSRRSPAGWEWDFRSAVRSSRPTTACCGSCPTHRGAQCFNSFWGAVPQHPPPPPELCSK